MAGQGHADEAIRAGPSGLTLNPRVHLGLPPVTEEGEREEEQHSTTMKVDHCRMPGHRAEAAALLGAAAAAAAVAAKMSELRRLISASAFYEVPHHRDWLHNQTLLRFLVAVSEPATDDGAVMVAMPPRPFPALTLALVMM